MTQTERVLRERGGQQLGSSNRGVSHGAKLWTVAPVQGAAPTPALPAPLPPPGHRLGCTGFGPSCRFGRIWKSRPIPGKPLHRTRRRSPRPPALVKGTVLVHARPGRAASPRLLCCPAVGQLRATPQRTPGSIAAAQPQGKGLPCGPSGSGAGEGPRGRRSVERRATFMVGTWGPALRGPGQRHSDATMQVT